MIARYICAFCSALALLSCRDVDGGKACDRIDVAEGQNQRVILLWTGGKFDNPRLAKPGCDGLVQNVSFSDDVLASIDGAVNKENLNRGEPMWVIQADASVANLRDESIFVNNIENIRILDYDVYVSELR